MAKTQVNEGIITKTYFLVFLAMDLTFKCVTVPAFIDLTNADVAKDHGLVTRAVVVALLCGIPFFATLALVVRPVMRWQSRRDADDAPIDELRRASRAIHRLPMVAAIGWSLEWLTYYILLSALGADVASREAVAFFLTAMLLGPPPLAHGLTTIFIAPAARRISQAARRRGVVIAPPFLRLGWRLALYSFCIGMAPTAYMASVAFAARVQHPSAQHLLMSVGIFFVGVTIFALLGAAFLSRGMTTPLQDMARVMRKITQQGDVSRVSRVPFQQGDEVGELGDLTNTMLDRLEETAAERAAAAAELSALNETLERRVDDRTAELSARNDDMRLVLDNVAEGLFTVDRSGTISAERSSVLETWFGAIRPQESYAAFMERITPSMTCIFELAWGQLIDDVFPVDVALEQLPAKFSRAGRHYTLSYRPIGGESWERLLVVVSDVTSEIERATAESERQEMYSLFEQAMSNGLVFLDFMDELDRLIANVAADQPKGDDVELKRDIHTIKGTALVFGLQSIGTLCHEIETEIAEGAAMHPSLFTKLARRWSLIQEWVGVVVGKRRNIVELSLQELDALERAVDAEAVSPKLRRLVHELRLEPVGMRLRYFAEQARQIAKRLQKPVSVDVTDDGLRLDPRAWAGFWAAFSHPIRNSVDHGIEETSERLAASKPAEGRLVLRAERSEGRICIAIEDDGAGIDWQAVGTAARARGLRAETSEELTAALFADGVSTAHSVTHLSGRGVGMSALLDATRGLGGRVDVSSTRGAGTRVEMCFPTG